MTGFEPRLSGVWCGDGSTNSATTGGKKSYLTVDRAT